MKKGLLFIFAMFFVAVSVNAQVLLESDPNFKPGEAFNNTKDVLMHWDGDNANALGLTAGGDMIGLAHFDAADLAGYGVVGGQLTEIHVYCNDLASATSIIVYDEAGGAPNSIIYEETVTISVGVWNTFTLATPVDLDGTDIFLGYRAVHVAGQFPSGIDGGPAVFKGDWSSLDGGSTWVHIGDYGFGNWNVRGNATEGVSKAPITFIVFNTGSTSYTGFELKGSWDGSGNYDSGWNGGVAHDVFYDDGTNGDATAGDDIWTVMQNLVPDAGANTWMWGVNDQDGAWIDGDFEFSVADDAAQTLTFTPLAVNRISAENISIYPNPSNGVFNVSVEANFNLEVFDITGKVINTQVLTGNSSIEINTAGVYFFRFSNEEGSVTQRVIVQ